jgi:hypothetical protein
MTAMSPDPAVMLDYAMRALHRLGAPDLMEDPGDADRSHRGELRARMRYAERAYRAIEIGADPNCAPDAPVISGPPVKVRYPVHEGDCNETCPDAT